MKGNGGTTMEKCIAVELDGDYEVVINSEGVAPRIVTMTRESAPELWVPEGTPDGSVILIKGRPGGGPKKKFRLFQVKDGKLQEKLNRNTADGWMFYCEDGCLFHYNRNYRVNPYQWGYCQVISKGWSPDEHTIGLFEEAGTQLPPSGIRADDRRFWVELMTKLINDRRRADRAEAALSQNAKMIYDEDMLTRGGALHSLLKEPGAVHFAANRVAKKLKEMFMICQQGIPDIQEPNAGSIGPDG